MRAGQHVLGHRRCRVGSQAAGGAGVRAHAGGCLRWCSGRCRKHETVMRYFTSYTPSRTLVTSAAPSPTASTRWGCRASGHRCAGPVRRRGAGQRGPLLPHDDRRRALQGGRGRVRRVERYEIESGCHCTVLARGGYLSVLSPIKETLAVRRTPQHVYGTHSPVLFPGETPSTRPSA